MAMHGWTEADIVRYRRQCVATAEPETKPAQANKYHAVRTEGYMSKAEATRARELAVLERAGEISNVLYNPTIHLLRDPDITYRPDYQYEDKNGTTRYEEVKGVETDRWRMIRKLWQHFGPGPLHVVRCERGVCRVTETIWPKPKTERNEG